MHLQVAHRTSANDVPIQRSYSMPHCYLRPFSVVKDNQLESEFLTSSVQHALQCHHFPGDGCADELLRRVLKAVARAHLPQSGYNCALAGK